MAQHETIISATRKSYFATRAMQRAAFDIRDAHSTLARFAVLHHKTPRGADELRALAKLESAKRRLASATTRYHNAQRVLKLNPLSGDF